VIYFLTVNYYSTELIRNLQQSIALTAQIPYRLIIVNNSVDDSTIVTLKNSHTVILNAEKNLGYGLACNLGLQWIYQTDPKAFVWIINPDTVLLNNAPQKAQDFLEKHSELSIVGSIVYDDTGEIWFAGGRFIPQIGEIFADTSIHKKPEKDYEFCDWISGCSLLINLSNFSTCPQFSADYFLYYEDFDFCRKYAAEGHLIAITSQIEILHNASSITSRDSYQKSKHSTYSYLFTLEKYTNQMVLWLRLLRVVLHAIVLLPLRYSKATGTLDGVFHYLKRKH
jgi:N-acetylglucosaminyl-diphospho-decaprenol L-rhamnosyltransferase